MPKTLRSPDDVTGRKAGNSALNPSGDLARLRIIRRPTHNLPLVLTSFIGREREIEAAKRLLSEARLVTLAGTGGCGKTRLAIQTAYDVIGSFDDGVWWVELAALSDESLIPQAIAQVLAVHEVPDQALGETLAKFLRAKQLLLVLDNCEHLITACALLVEHLLSGCPNLKILATSREPLAIGGETVYQVPPLSLPKPQLSSPTQLLQSEAVRLFVERSRAVRPDFSLVDQNARTVARICQRLDGIPLAIELAAARLKLLTVDQIAARLDDRFNLLTMGSRTALPRQQTLRATLDWSYNLLSEPDRAFLMQLSVFAGGWTFEAAESVCIGPSNALDILTSLVDKSLVVIEQTELEPRYHLLETVRQYAQDKLIASGEIDQVRRRHLRFFVKLAEEAEPKLEGVEQIVWLNRLEREHDNVRVALQWSFESGEAELGLCIAGSLDLYWFIHRHWSEGRQWLGTALAHGKDSPALARAKALFSAGSLAVFQSDYEEGVALCEQSLTLYRELGNKRGMSWALFTQGMAAGDQGDIARSIELVEESLSLWRDIGDKRGIAYSLNLLGEAARDRGDYSAARGHLEDALRLFRETGDQWGIGLVLDVLAEVAQREHDYQRAEDLSKEALALWRELGDKRMTAIALLGLGIVANREGDNARSRVQLIEALALLQKVGDKYFIASALEALASLEQTCGNPEQAARLFGVAENLRQVMNMPLPPDVRADYEQSISEIRAQVAEAAFQKAWAEGRGMSLEQAVEYGLKTSAPLEEPEPPVRPLTPRLAAKQEFAGLTVREREVAMLIAEGKSNRQIAEALVISERTVTTHVANILNKLGFGSRAQVAAWAVQKGLREKQSKG